MIPSKPMCLLTKPSDIHGLSFASQQPVAGDLAGIASISMHNTPLAHRSRKALSSGLFFERLQFSDRASVLGYVKGGTYRRTSTIALLGWVALLRVAAVAVKTVY